jgi:hypothetical protein
MLSSQIPVMRTFIAVALTCVAELVSAQSVTIDNVPAHVEYFRIPDQPLDPSFTTYSADIDVPFSQLGKTGITKSSLIDQYLVLDGYKKVNSKGDVEITATIGDFTVWSESTNTHRTKTKDKNGKEIEKVSYNLEVKYSLPISLQVYDKNGFMLADQYISSSSDTRTWTSVSYNSLADLDSYWRYERPNRLTQLQKELLSQGMNSLSDELNKRFGYRKIKDTVKFETIGKKKHPQYDEFQKNTQIIQDAFKLMSADKGLEEIKVKIQPALDFFNAAAAKYKSSSKDDTKMRHICLYNQGLAAYWMEDFDQAEFFANEIQRKDKKDKDVKRLLDVISNTRESLAAAHQTSRHMINVASRT